MAVASDTSVWKLSLSVGATVVDGQILEKYSRTIQKVRENVSDEALFGMAYGIMSLTKYKDMLPTGLTVSKVETTPLAWEV